MTAPLKLCVRRSEVAAPSGHVVDVSVVLPSEIQHIEAAVELMARHCFAGHPSTSRLRFRLQVTLSEALANAIICGNGQDPSKHVTIQAQCRSDAIELSVADEGTGFSPDQITAPMTGAEIESQCGRGLFLIRHLADHVAFNEEGNAICITLRRP
ncbi:MAG: ATP-binding protein [Gemmatimonadales bacterium]|nr:ATP-binding protein [Gemmatimonadales bacterium]